MEPIREITARVPRKENHPDPVVKPTVQQIINSEPTGPIAVSTGANEEIFVQPTAPQQQLPTTHFVRRSSRKTVKPKWYHEEFNNS